MNNTAKWQDQSMALATLLQKAKAEGGYKAMDKAYDMFHIERGRPDLCLFETHKCKNP